MSEFIVIGIIVILAVNTLYSRFCEKSNGDRAQIVRNQKQGMVGRGA